MKTYRRLRQPIYGPLLCDVCDGSGVIEYTETLAEFFGVDAPGDDFMSGTTTLDGECGSCRGSGTALVLPTSDADVLEAWIRLSEALLGRLAPPEDGLSDGLGDEFVVIREATEIALVDILLEVRDEADAWVQTLRDLESRPPYDDDPFDGMSGS